MTPLSIALALATQYAPGLIKHMLKSETAGTVAGQVIEIAKTVTGAETEDAARTAIAASPEAAAEFQKAAQEFGAALELAYLEDIKVARERDVELAKLGRRNIRADIMVLLDVVGLVACLVVLVFYRDQIPGEAVGLISSVAATFGLCLRDAHTFEFGSTRMSQTKDIAIRNLTK